MTTPVNRKDLLLGTAQWGWTVSSDSAFQLLDAWIGSGRRAIDTATNYPINKIAGDFRAAERLLETYIRTHGLTNLQITMKIGSLDNMLLL
ncbi:MAG: aldo/keto reductase [Saprospirales bacterium]|nr:aldo/keto reductase [Saprospirales bacterium]